MLPDKWGWSLVGSLLGALLLAACGSVRLPQSPLLRVFERKSGLIVFVGMDGNIYTMNQAGEDIVAITDDAVVNDPVGGSQTYYFPAWARGGRQLAFAGYRRHVSGSFQTSLYTVNSDGSDRAEVFSSDESAPFYLYWGPDGEKIGFLTSGGQAGDMALRMVPASGGEAVVVEQAQPFYWAWAPDGHSLVAHTGGPVQTNPDGARMWRYDVDRMAVEPLSMAPSLFQTPAFSPDGEYFAAAVHDRSGQDSLVVATAEGQIEADLTEIGDWVAFDWAPKGDRLAFISGQSTAVGLIGKLDVFDLRDLENPKLIETDADGVMAFFWSPDGSQLAYFSPRVLENDAGERTIVMQVATMNARNGESKVLATIRAPESFLSQIVPFYDQYQRSATIWSPDGRNLVINALAADNRPAIFIVPADGSIDPRFVEHGTMAFWSWK